MWTVQESNLHRPLDHLIVGTIKRSSSRSTVELTVQKGGATPSPRTYSVLSRRGIEPLSFRRSSDKLHRPCGACGGSRTRTYYSGPPEPALWVSTGSNCHLLPSFGQALYPESRAAGLEHRVTTPIKLEILVCAALPDSNQHLLHAFTPPPSQG